MMTRDLFKQIAILSAFVAVVVWIFASWLFSTPTSGRESNALAEISWRVGGDKMTVVFTLSDAVGRPVAGVTIRGSNDSGGDIVTTDSRGMARIKSSESEGLYAIDVGDVRILDRKGDKIVPNLPVVEGLNVEIKLKDGFTVRAHRGGGPSSVPAGAHGSP